MSGTISYAMMQSLDGFIAGPEGGPSMPPPEKALHQHFNDCQKRSVLTLYGRRMWETMVYWETGDTQPEADEVEKEFARLWRETPKVVFSTTLGEVAGTNVRLVRGDIEKNVRALRDEHDGPIDVSGAGLAASLSRLGLIDEYRLYFMPIVLGGGRPFFEAGSSLQLEPIGTEMLPQGVLLARFRPRR